jgi:hypothetical protein
MPVALTPLETKLLHLILNGAAAPGEIATGSAKLVESLRKRGVEAEEIENTLNRAVPRYTRPDFGLVTCPFKKHKGELARDIDPNYLKYMISWVRNHNDPGVIQKFSQWADDMEVFLNQ